MSRRLFFFTAEGAASVPRDCPLLFLFHTFLTVTLIHHIPEGASGAANTDGVNYTPEANRRRRHVTLSTLSQHLREFTSTAAAGLIPPTLLLQTLISTVAMHIGKIMNLTFDEAMYLLETKISGSNSRAGARPAAAVLLSTTSSDGEMDLSHPRRVDMTAVNSDPDLKVIGV
jgi:hypothetical protein